MQSAKDVLRPFSRVMLKLISTGNQLSPDMIHPDHFADWGPNISKVEAPLKMLRKAIPMPTLNTTDTAWEVNLKTSVELYTIWEETGVLKQLERHRREPVRRHHDIMDEKREDWKECLDEQEEAKTRRLRGHGRSTHERRTDQSGGDASPATAPNGATRTSRPRTRASRPPGSRKIDKRSMLTGKERVEDVRDVMWQLEKDGEIVVHRVTDAHEPVDGQDALRLGQEDPDDASSGTTSRAASAATSPAIRPRCCGS